MPRLNFVDWVAFILVIIGAFFWGVVGILGAPFLSSLATMATGTMTLFRVIWLLVGISGFWIIYTLYKLSVPAMKQRMAHQ